MGRGKPGRPRKWTRGTEMEVRRLRREGLKQQAIAWRLGVSVGLVCQILRGFRR